MTATTHTPSRVERPNPNSFDTPSAAGSSGARRCRIRIGANMFIKRIYRGLPTIVLLVVAALIEFLAINAFA
jgi:hypothetical protein